VQSSSRSVWHLSLFSVRGLIVLVLVTVPPLTLAAGVFWLLSPEQVRLGSLINAYNAKAKHHAETEREFARLSEYSNQDRVIAIRGGHRVHLPMGQDPELVPEYVELAKYHGVLRRKYEGAAWHPRLPVEPDPPAPELRTVEDRSTGQK
jgi:hypothetical protein